MDKQCLVLNVQFSEYWFGFKQKQEASIIDHMYKPSKVYPHNSKQVGNLIRGEVNSVGRKKWFESFP